MVGDVYPYDSECYPNTPPLLSLQSAGGCRRSLQPDALQPRSQPIYPRFSEREAILLSHAILVFTRPPASLRRRGEPRAPLHPTLTPQALLTEVIYCVSSQGAGECSGGDAGVAEGLFVSLLLSGVNAVRCVQCWRVIHY